MEIVAYSLMNKPTKATSVNEIKKDSDIITDRKCTAETFNNHFVEVGHVISHT